MPTNPQNGVEIPLSLFGGLDTELAPSDIPEGVSPANNDVVYLPGSVASRPCLRQLFATSISGLPPLKYQKTYLQPNGDPLNLYLDASGALWKEDVNNSPGQLSQILAVTPGSTAKSCTAFGSEWIAVSNGETGTDVPRQYNGTYLDRVTQDGPGAPPSAADYTASATITSIGVNSSTIAAGGIVSATDPTNTFAQVVITTTAAHGLQPGALVQIVGAGQPQVNGQQVVLTVPSADSFTISVTFPTVSISSAGRTSNVAIISSLVAHNLIVGDTVNVFGVSDTSFNGVQTVTAVPNNAQWEFASSGSNTAVATPDAFFTPQTLYTAGGGLVAASGTATFAALPANAGVGDPLQVSGSAGAGSTYPYDSNVGGNPASWPILSISGLNITFSLAGIAGLTASNYGTTGGTATVGGLSSAGQYQVVQFFQLRSGAYTAPSPPFTYTSNGGAKVQVGNLAIGPSNAVARVLAFTGSGGANFFAIPSTITLANQMPGGQPISIQATVVPDNTSTSAIFDFSDNALYGALGIDIPGNNLFNQAVLAPCTGFFSFAERLFAWGEWNKIENLLNMGFDGGYIAANVPTGWTVATGGGTLTASGVDYGFGWEIAGDGSANPIGQITQPAYQDYEGVAILTPGTQYGFRVWLEASGTAGTLTVDLYSPTDGVLATGSVALSGVSAVGQFYSAEWSAETPAVMPPDAVLRVYATSQANAQTVTVDELSIVPAANPVNLQARGSYIDNPNAFDGETGTIGPDADPTPVKGMGLVRDSLAIVSGLGPYVTTDSQSGEPATWTLDTVSKSAGALSINAVDAGQDGTGDSGEEWILIAARGGLYIYEGGQLPKISQEIQATWERINWAAQSTIWVKNDTVARRAYVGVPLDGAAAPSHILVLDRRELETAGQIAQSPPMRISYTGKMIASDLCRKWTIWNLAMNCGELLARPGGDVEFAVGCGSAFGQAYTFDAALYTDQDYGQMSPSYTTFFFVNHEAEQQLGLGSQRKLFKQINLSASGVGSMLITPLADALSNNWPAPPAYPLPSVATQDQPLGLNVTAERCAFTVASRPAAGQTDNGFILGKMVVMAATCPVAQTAGSVV